MGDVQVKEYLVRPAMSPGLLRLAGFDGRYDDARKPLRMI